MHKNEKVSKSGYDGRLAIFCCWSISEGYPDCAKAFCWSRGVLDSKEVLLLPFWLLKASAALLIPAELKLFSLEETV